MPACTRQWTPLVDTPEAATPAESATVHTPRAATDPADELNALGVTCPSDTECMEQPLTQIEVDSDLDEPAPAEGGEIATAYA